MERVQRMKTATSPTKYSLTRAIEMRAIKSTNAKSGTKFTGPLAMVAATAALTLSLGMMFMPLATAQETTRTIATGSNIPLASDAPDKYTVKRGDTLWDIAKVFLRDPWYWPEIWYVNPQVKNPHLIYPGDVLSLVSKDGVPQVMVTERGPEVTEAEATSAAPDTSATTNADTGVRHGSGTRLSPRVHSSPITSAITAIPYETVVAFMGKPSLLSKEQVKSGPYVVGVRDLHLIAGEDNELYARGIRDAAVGARYNIIHVDSPLRDPENNKTLGYRAVLAGVAAVTAEGDPAKLKAHMTQREILRGDKLFPEEVTIDLNFIPHSAPENVRGSIAAVDGVFIVGKYQTVAINRGLKQGVEIGHVFAIKQKGERITDRYQNGGEGNTWSFGKRVKLPNEQIGLVMVFKTYERMSYGLIMESTHPVRVGDEIVAP